MSTTADPIGLDTPTPAEIARAIRLSELLGLDYLTGLALAQARPEGRAAARVALEGERLAYGEGEWAALEGERLAYGEGFGLAQ